MSRTIRFSVFDISFLGNFALHRELLSRLEILLQTDPHDLFVIDSSAYLETRDLLVLGADALVVNPDEHDERWQLIADAHGMGLPVFVRSGERMNLERANNMGIPSIAEARGVEGIASAIANFFRYQKVKI